MTTTIEREPRNPSRGASETTYFGGGGGGLGVPVVSYAPRPMLLLSDSLKIMLTVVGLRSALIVSMLFHKKVR